MRITYILSVCCLAPLLVACNQTTNATGGRSEQTGGVAVPCGEIPRDAVMKVPASLANDMQVVCAKTGHVLMAAPGLGWRTPQGMLGLPAINPNNPTVTGPSAYFTKLLVHRPETGARRRLLQALAAAQVPQDFYQSADIKVLEVEASTGLKKRIYYFTTPGKRNLPPRRWGLQCYDQCVPLSGALTFDVVAAP